MSEERKDGYGQIIKYTGIFGGVQGLNILIGLVRNKVVALLLGPAGMGLVSLFNSVVSFISQGTNFGVPFSAVRQVSELYEKGDEAQLRHFVKVVRCWSLLTAVLGMMVCVLVGPLMSNYTFSWGNHTLHFMLLAPAIGLMAVSGGETAILKGMRQLRSLALIQLMNVFVALLISVPVYYFFGQSGIVPVIVLMALSMLLLTIRHSFRLIPYDVSGMNSVLGDGAAMIRLGIAFVFAGVMDSGAEMVVRSYLNVVDDLEVVGLFNTGFMLTTAYAGLVFTALETEYFPRLSSVASDRAKTNETVNRQIEVTLLIAAPMLSILIVGLPVAVPLLFTSEFLPVVDMARVVLLSMCLRAVYLPIAYVTLAKGDSVQYFLLELVYDVLIVLLVVVCFTVWGLFGTGVALALANVSDLVVILVYSRMRYGFTLSPEALRYFAVHLLLCSLTYASTFIPSVLGSWLAGLLLCGGSLAVSLTVLRRKSSLWNALMKRLKARR